MGILYSSNNYCAPVRCHQCVNIIGVLLVAFHNNYKRPHSVCGTHYGRSQAPYYSLLYRYRPTGTAYMV